MTPGPRVPDHPFVAEGRNRSLIPAICGEWPASRQARCTGPAVQGGAAVPGEAR